MKTLILTFAVLALVSSQMYASSLEHENALLRAQIDDAQSLMVCVNDPIQDTILTKAEP